jgi:hypothetical protein
MSLRESYVQKNLQKVSLLITAHSANNPLEPAIGNLRFLMAG